MMAPGKQKSRAGFPLNVYPLSTQCVNITVKRAKADGKLPSKPVSAYRIAMLIQNLHKIE